MRQQKYSSDLIADILQRDGNRYTVSGDYHAYFSVADALRRQNADFFGAFCDYRLLGYTNQNDLLSTLMLINDPKMLMYIAGFDSDFGLEVFEYFVRWRYDEPPRDPESADAPERRLDERNLVRAVGRFSRQRRLRALEILSESVAESGALEAMLQVRNTWDRIAREEPERAEALRVLRQVIVDADRRGVHSAQEATVLLQEIHAVSSLYTVGQHTVRARYQHYLAM